MLVNFRYWWSTTTISANTIRNTISKSIKSNDGPYRRLAFGSQTLQQVTPGAGTATQTIAPMPQGNPFLQAAGAIGSIGTGLGELIGLMSIYDKKIMFNRGGLKIHLFSWCRYYVRISYT